MKYTAGILAALALPAWVTAAPAETPTVTVKDRALKERTTTSVTVSISASATVVGEAYDSIDSFVGIPYAQPPTGSLRLKPPQALTTALGTFDGTGTAAACPQMIFSTDSDNWFTEILGYIANTPFVMSAATESEDCLTLNILRPSGTTSDSKLPVLYWIFGGGFELGWSSMYDGHSLLSNAMSMDEPFIFVAVNYRVAGWGFMPGKEILADQSANLGLRDQRMGLEWVADNIEAFGGDPEKVTLWGESAGAISVMDQLALYGGNNTYNGKALFRGAIMDSGSLVPAEAVDSSKAQAIYDEVVSSAGCSSASDTLTCLRDLSEEDFANAANSVPGILSYHSVALSYMPRPDGDVLPDSPDVLVAAGQYAAVPMIIGDQEDEGTIFALFQSNITTVAEVAEYLNTYFFQEASSEQMTQLVAAYPDTTTYGSPFRTWIFNNIYAQYKRLAAILGDLTFTLTRRVFLTMAKTVNPDVPTWSYLSSYDYGTLILGTFHASDLLQVFFGVLDNYASNSIQTYYFNFVTNLDPNVGNTDYSTWPEWTTSGRDLVQFYAHYSTSLEDTFREDAYEFLYANVSSLHI